MKKVAGVLAALMISGSAMAVEQTNTAEPYCKAMISNQTAQGGLFTAFSIKFYLTSEADYQACRKIAADDDGAKVIIDPSV